MSVLNPKGPSTGNYRIVRGGSWNGYTNYLVVSSRNISPPGSRGHGIGFCIVCNKRKE